MNDTKLLKSFTEFANEKGIDKPTLIKILEQAFRSVIIARYGSDENFNVVIDLNHGGLQMWRSCTIVADEDFHGKYDEIKLSEAQKIEPDFDLGEECTTEINITDFKSSEISLIREHVLEQLSKFEQNMFYERYEQLVGSVVTVKVSCLTKNYTIVIDEKNNELFLPIKDQLHQDNFAKGNIIKALVVKIIVKRGKPVVLLSRTEPLFLEKLLSFEIPEILDGLVIIKKIARIPGEKSKVVVESIDGRIDPVGTCIGIRGSRISGVSKELGNESIDIIQYSDNQQLFISRVLGSVFIRKLDILQSQIIIYVEKEQMAKAIGKNAYNIRLLKKLLNQDINIVEYNEKFENEKNINVLLEYIDEWVVIELKKAGFFTVESVLSVSPKELEEKADLETETVNDIYKILEKINKD